MPYKDKKRQKAYNKQYYLTNHNKIIQQTRKWLQLHPGKTKIYGMRSREKRRILFNQIKQQYHCIRCGESDPICLDFHHKNSLEKDLDIGRSIGYSLCRLIAEIKKCDCLCSNCHRKEHARLRRDFLSPNGVTLEIT